MAREKVLRLGLVQPMVGGPHNNVKSFMKSLLGFFDNSYFVSETGKISGLRMMVKSGLEENFLKILHALAIVY